jgi:hypothetical protein
MGEGTNIQFVLKSWKELKRLLNAMSFLSMRIRRIYSIKPLDVDSRGFKN